MSTVANDELTLTREVAIPEFNAKLAAAGFGPKNEEDAYGLLRLGDIVTASVNAVHTVLNASNDPVKRALEASFGSKPKATEVKPTEDPVKSASDYMKLPNVLQAALAITGGSK